MTLTIEAPQAPVAAPAKTVADILEHAALIIEEHGHCKGLNTDGDGRHCAVGAVQAALGVANPWDHWTGGQRQSYADAKAALIQAIDFPFITAWNDDPERTADDVTAALRFAAERAQ